MTGGDLAQAATPNARFVSEHGGRYRLIQICALVLAALVVAPLLLIITSWLDPQTEVWRHLRETVLGQLLLNTLILAVGVSVGVSIFGIGLAWLTSMCEFPGRRFFEWALMLPLAIPAYVSAFVMLGLFDFSGPLQTLLRGVFGPHGYWFPEVRSGGGVITVMVLVLYPYVYMLARVAFLTQGRTTMDAARVLGLGPWGGFLRAVLPMARPAIVVGVSLALMEALADFGAVAVFNYDTFTTAIYKSWFGLFSLQAASQLSTLLLLFVALVLLGERRLRGRARYHAVQPNARAQRYLLTGGRRWFATGTASMIFAVAFMIPVVQLMSWAWTVIGTEFSARYLGLLLHTLTLGATAAVITVTGAMSLAYIKRFHGDRVSRALVSMATLGYALPGTVLAVGIMLTFTGVDRFVNSLWLASGGETSLRIFSGTVAVLLLAYLVRFLAVAFGPIESSFARIRPSLSDAARSLGAAPAELMRRVYLPLLRPGLLAAALLVVVEVMKEMPATLLLRPFGWDTLAVRIFEMTSEGEWERAALPAITLVFAGLLPVIFLVRRSAGAVFSSAATEPD
ncbi:MAG: iron ABC transporter permease [Gammaproteobacteria bacterium]|nr:iron ABC transporter permease [Gammaproteobacteria bacterium]